MGKIKNGSNDQKSVKSIDNKKGMTPVERNKKESFIEKEFKKLFKERYFSELEEGHYVFISSYIVYDYLKDYSSYEEKLIELDFSDYLTKNETCFFCYIDFNIEYFIDDFIDYYKSILNS